MYTTETVEPRSLGADLAKRLGKAIHEAGQVPRPGARDLPVIRGVNQSGATNGLLENTLTEVGDVLTRSGCVFGYGNSVVLQIGKEGKETLVTLATDYVVEPAAKNLLANYLVCTDGNKQFAPPASLVSTLFTREPTIVQLPQVKLYAKRPVFDPDFVLRGPGWHPEYGILVHGIDVEPAELDCVDTSQPTLERLPPHLQELLRDFSFKSGADLANAVGLLLTGQLSTLFIESGKPIGLLDGNQPNLGKTWLARVMGVVLDDEEPILVRFTPDEEELQKSICAGLKSGGRSVLLIDNAKISGGGAISSPTIEANSVAPEITLRILGESRTLSRPNGILWIFTMNDTKADDDIVSRGIPIRFFFEGNTQHRDFGDRNPIEYAKEHRAELLGELAGMVNRWNLLGRPPGHQTHRLKHWATVVGGIMEANGFPEFLSNLDEAASEFNTTMDDIGVLAEVVFKTESGPFVVTSDDEAAETVPEPALPAKDWEKFIKKAGIAEDKLKFAKSRKAKETIIGNLLTKGVGRDVVFSTDENDYQARLVVQSGRAKRKEYYFQLERA